MVAVYREGEFNLLGMEVETLHSIDLILSIESVADNRHPETHFRGSMHPKLMGASRDWMKLYPASPCRNTLKFIICLRLFPSREINLLARTIEPVCREREGNMPLAGKSGGHIIPIQFGDICLFHPPHGKKPLDNLQR